MTFSGRVEAKFTVPSATTVSATNSGGGPTVVTAAAGSYYHTAAGGVSGFLATFQGNLNTTRAPTSGKWTVTLSTGASGTGQVTIDCTSGGTLTKTGGVDGANDAGANITTSLTGDGFVEMTAAVASGSTRVVVGLAPSNTSAGRDSGYYFELVEAGALWVRELGVDVGQVSTWADGDVLRVRRTGATITYEKNGAVVYTSLATVSVGLFGDFSLKNASSEAVGVRLYDATNGYQAVTWANVTNVTTSATTWSLAWTSTAPRDLLGFTADISAVSSPQTGTKQARGVWRADCPLTAAVTPKRAPMVTDLITTQGPTGVVLGQTGNSFYRQKSLAWTHVPVAQVWESDATTANASWEFFLKDTQFGQGLSWFSVSSPLQIYDHNSVLVGLDANSGAGVAGWQITGLDSIEPTQSVQDWDQRWRIEIPQLVSAG